MNPDSGKSLEEISFYSKVRRYNVLKKEWYFETYKIVFCRGYKETWATYFVTLSEFSRFDWSSIISLLVGVIGFVVSSGLVSVTVVSLVDLLYNAAKILNNITETGLYREIGRKVTSGEYMDGDYIFILNSVTSILVYSDGNTKNKKYYEI